MHPSNEHSATGRSRVSFFALLTAMFALVLLGIGGFFGIRNTRLDREGSVVTGIVVDYHEQEDEDQNIRYAPVVEYRVAENAYRVAGQSYRTVPAFEFGDPVEILYDPADPNTAVLYTRGELWGIPLLFLGLGVVMLLVATGIQRRHREG